MAPAHPIAHLAPERGWMNDPNGLSFIDGVWHAYYQHNPHDDVWGPMHWRHATSRDLMAWTDHGIVLWPGEFGAIFSGSVVVDRSNTAGFGAGARVAVFTLDDDHDQRQALAWSDDGFQWTTFDGNPVLIDTDEKHFRDPKVLRFGERWVMALGVGRGIRFYSSPDLKVWEQTGVHRPDPGPINPIECPDLVCVGTDAGEECWLLIYGDDRGGASEHSSTMGIVGLFDGAVFEPLSKPQFLDHGPDFYAAQTFWGVTPEKPPVLMAWMNSWQYANVHPSSGRRGVMSLPRSLSVDSLAKPVLRSRPAVNLDSLPSGRSPKVVVGTSFSVSVRSSAGPVATVWCDDGSVHLERPDLGIDGMGVDVTLAADGPLLVVVDHGTLEVFTADGRTISALIFPGVDWTLDVTGDGMITPRRGSSPSS